MNDSLVYPFRLRYLGARVTPSRSLQSSPRFHRQGLVACTCDGGRMSVPRAGTTRQEWKAKKPLSLTPVEEPKSRGLRLPHSGSGSGLTAPFAAASTPSAFSISTNGNKMQAEKKNPSDPDAVVTADAGALWLMALREKPWSPCAFLSHQVRQHVLLLLLQVRQAQAHTHLVKGESAIDVPVAVR